MFALWSMLTTLTLYTYVIGEISSIVMANDQALVSMREEFMRVQSFIKKHAFPQDLSIDIITTFHDRMYTNPSAEHVTDLLSSNLRVEVAMQMSLPLVKGNKLFSSCSPGFTASLGSMLREVTMASDEVLFRANDVCNELFIVASSCINMLTTDADGEDKVCYYCCTFGQIC